MKGVRSLAGRTFLPTGRFERRIAKAEVLELLRAGESPIAKVEAITENVSPQGARVITESICVRGELVRLEAPGEHLQLPARVVYCHRLEERRFAVGLQLDVRVERWKEPL